MGPYTKAMISSFSELKETRKLDSRKKENKKKKQPTPGQKGCGMRIWLGAVVLACLIYLWTI